MDAKDWSLLALTKRQQGLVTYAQARAVGFTTSAIKWRLTAGEWTRVLPGVARMFWADDTWTTRCWAASLWADSSTTALSHTTAARLLGFDLAPDFAVHVTTEVERSQHPRRWCHHHRAMLHIETSEVSGLCVTSPARTLLDLAVILNSSELERVLRGAINQRQVTTTALRKVLRPCRGKNGVVRLRTLFKRLVRE